MNFLKSDEESDTKRSFTTFSVTDDVEEESYHPTILSLHLNGPLLSKRKGGGCKIYTPVIQDNHELLTRKMIIYRVKRSLIVFVMGYGYQSFMTVLRKYKVY